MYNRAHVCPCLYKYVRFRSERKQSLGLSAGRRRVYLKTSDLILNDFIEYIVAWVDILRQVCPLCKLWSSWSNILDGGSVYIPGYGMFGEIVDCWIRGIIVRS